MPAAFPTTTTVRITTFTERPRDYSKPVITHEFKDGSASYNRVATIGERVFDLEYENLLTAESDALDAHHDACFGAWLGFTFTHPKTGEVLTNVHYLKYDSSPSSIDWRKRRSVSLIWRP
jgi:hypothetical protein